jgi:hypothetical protein
MGIIKDNNDNTGKENLTFFFDGSKKLNEFVVNKSKGNQVSCSSRGADGVTNKSFGSEKEIPRHFDKLSATQARNSNGSILHSAREKVSSDSSVSSSRHPKLGEAVVENSAVNPEFSPLGKCPQDNGASNSSSTSSSTAAP